jgi:hypothetical protein
MAHHVLPTGLVRIPGFIGASAAAAFGRNPGSSTPVIVQSVLPSRPSRPSSLDALFCEVIRDVRHDHHQARLVGVGQKRSTIAQLISVLQDAGAMRQAIVVAVPADSATS